MPQCPVPAAPLLPGMPALIVDHDWTEDDIAEFRRQWDALWADGGPRGPQVIWPEGSRCG